MNEPNMLGFQEDGRFPHRHYPKAPIVEATINLQVEVLSKTATIEKLSVAFDRFAQTDFVKTGEESTLQGQLSREEGWKVSTSSTGIRYLKKDRRHGSSVRLNGFSYTRLAPYNDWESFRDEARQVWNQYRLAAGDLRVVAISLRYVNRIELPIPTPPNDMWDFRWYLRTYPEVSTDLDTGLSSYFMRLEIQRPKINSVLVLNQVCPPRKLDSKNVMVILDSDLIMPTPTGPGESEIWANFELLRNEKNEVFESCITNRARRLFV